MEEMEKRWKCPECGSENTAEDGEYHICRDCGFDEGIFLSALLRTARLFSWDYGA